LASPPGSLPCSINAPNVGESALAGSLGMAATVSSALRIFSTFFASSFLSSSSARALPYTLRSFLFEPAWQTLHFAVSTAAANGESGFT
jgi:hypothetical protein